MRRLQFFALLGDDSRDQIRIVSVVNCNIVKYCHWHYFEITLNRYVYIVDINMGKLIRSPIFSGN
jgi:hypothetical protein